MKGWKKGESAAAALLQKWWGVRFYRTPASGGMATSRSDSLPPSIVAAMRGDVTCDLQDKSLDSKTSFPFIVEVKSYAAIDLYALLRRGAFEILPGSKPKGESDLWLCWYQAKIEAFRGHRWPLLIYKEDRKSWYVVFQNRKEFSHITHNTDALFFQDMVIMLWTTFADVFTRQIVEEFARTAIQEGNDILKSPDRWSEPPDLAIHAEQLLDE